MSFRARLAIAHLALLALALSAFGFGVYAYVDRRLHQELYDSVQSQGHQLAQVLYQYSNAQDVLCGARSGDSLIGLGTRPDRDPTAFLRVDVEGEANCSDDTAGDKNTVTNPSGVLLPKVREGRVTTVLAGDGANSTGASLAAYAEHFGAVAAQRPNQGRLPSADARRSISGTVTVARSLEGVSSSLSLLRTILLSGGLAVLATATLLSFGLSAALLQPLRRMRSTAQRIGDERDFTRRMPVFNRDELGRLSITFNQMLTELERSHTGLKTALEAQRRFVADASHELRTPVTAIRTNIEFLTRVPRARTEDRMEALGDMLSETRRMEGLVGDLLALARLEAASTAVRRPLRLDHLLADIHRDALRVARPGVDVRIDAAADVWVSGDREDLRRAVWNLVDNALKYTPSGRVELRLDVVGRRAKVVVSDTGIGIGDADREHVFDRFWRASGVRGAPGSGLGLAITKWVAQVHGGSVAVTSASGEGSSFTLELPLLDRGGPPGPAERREDAASPPARLHSAPVPR